VPKYDIERTLTLEQPDVVHARVADAPEATVAYDCEPLIVNELIVQLGVTPATFAVTVRVATPGALNVKF